MEIGSALTLKVRSPCPRPIIVIAFQESLWVISAVSTATASSLIAILSRDLLMVGSNPTTPECFLRWQLRGDPGRERWPVDANAGSAASFVLESSMHGLLPCYWWNSIGISLSESRFFWPGSGGWHVPLQVLASSRSTDEI